MLISCNSSSLFRVKCTCIRVIYCLVHTVNPTATCSDRSKMEDRVISTNGGDKALATKVDSSTSNPNGNT